MNIDLLENYIETERLVLFPFTAENLALFNEDLNAFESKYGVKYRGEELTHPFKIFLKKLQKQIEEDEKNYLFFTVFLIVFKQTDTVVGSIDFKYVPKDCVTEVGYGLNPKYEGNGFMTEALGGFLRFGKALGIKKVLAETLKDNVRSQNVLRRCGFSFDREDDNYRFIKTL